MGMKIGGEGQFDMLKMIGCELNPNMPPEVIFRQWGCVGVQVLKSVIPVSLSPIVVPTPNFDF